MKKVGEDSIGGGKKGEVNLVPCNGSGGEHAMAHVSLFFLFRSGG